MKKLWKEYLECAQELNGILFGMCLTFGLALCAFIVIILLKNNGIF